MENTDDGIQEGERGGVVTARGTGDGLVIRLDGSVDPLELRESLADFLSSRKAFLEGNEVALEWVGAMPEKAMVDALSLFLNNEFSISVKESRFREQKRAGGDSASRAPEAGTSPILSIRSLRDSGRQGDASSSSATDRRTQRGRFVRDVPYRESNSGDFFNDSASADSAAGYSPSRSEGTRKVSLFDGIEVMSIPGDQGDVSSRFGSEGSGREKSVERGGSDRSPRSGVNPLLWDDPDARIINATLRSGQRVESDHSIIVRGDVNSGAEVIAGGDIIILGTLRGIAHAGAFDDTGGGRSIVALSLQPTQLRIGSLISRGKSDGVGTEAGQGIEVARIEGNIIVVEPYQVRGGSRRSS